MEVSLTVYNQILPFMVRMLCIVGTLKVIEGIARLLFFSKAGSTYKYNVYRVDFLKSY